MAETPRRLPRGRHGLSREQVQASQRARMLAALADAMARNGYVGTSVADVIAGAGVSRESFYQQFSSKLDCFMAAFDVAGELLMASLRPLLLQEGTPLERFDLLLERYLGVLAQQPAYARLFLVEVYAAGPAALKRRDQWQAEIVDALMDLLQLPTDERFSCALVVAGTGAMVIGPLMNDDLPAIRALHDPVSKMVIRLSALSEGIITQGG